MEFEQICPQLCALPGPSGWEGPVAHRAAQLLRPWVDEVAFTRLGSVVGVRRCGIAGAPKVLLDAHLDEIGFIVTGHEEGFLTFTALGGVDPRMLPNREVQLLTTPPTTGIVVCLPPHIQSREEMDKAPAIQELYIDVGLSQAQAQRQIPVGTPAVYAGGAGPLGEELLCGKALDDRAGFAVLLDVAQRLQGEALDVDLYFLGSTREETHSTGAITAAFQIAPDLCVAVDVTHGATPDASKDKTFPLGGGPVIGVGPNCTRWMQERLVCKAKELDIDCQLEVMAGHTGTNGWPMQISREGVATALLSIPLRYMHTPVEVVHRRDLTQSAQLLAAFLRGIGREVPVYD